MEGRGGGRQRDTGRETKARPPDVRGTALKGRYLGTEIRSGALKAAYWREKGHAVLPQHNRRERERRTPKFAAVRVCLT